MSKLHIFLVARYAIDAKVASFLGNKHPRTLGPIATVGFAFPTSKENRKAGMTIEIDQINKKNESHDQRCSLCCCCRACHLSRIGRGVHKAFNVNPLLCLSDMIEEWRWFHQSASTPTMSRYASEAHGWWSIERLTSFSLWLTSCTHTKPHRSQGSGMIWRLSCQHVNARGKRSE